MRIQLPQRYRLDDRPLLGEGGMGRVLRARDVILDTPVALKIVRPELAVDVRFRELFDLEIRVSARFTHPHIVPLHDHGETPDGTPYLGLAYADAGSFAVLRSGEVPWYELLRLVLQLLDALAHLHARDVLHRDLKPENVLLTTGPDRKRHVWLADLGLANASSTLARKKGRTEGSPGYMSPEQFLGMPREYGPWTDLYSLGVVLWELTTGRRPFPDDRSAHEAPLPPFVPRPGLAVPRDLEVVLANLLHPEPLSRYDLAADLRTELLALDDPGYTSEIARTPSPPPRSSDSLGGTVAPSAPPLSSGVQLERAASSSADSPPGERDADDPAGGPRFGPPPGADPKVPVWNRPLPPPMPPTPRPEPGSGVTARASLPLFALRELPLIARDALRAELWKEARLVATEGRPRVVVLVGEVGSGKSRLVQSVRLALEEGGWAETVILRFQEQPGADDGYAGAARAIIRPWKESRASLEARVTRRLARERGRLDPAIRDEAAILCRWAGLGEEGEEPVPVGFGLREVHRTLEAREWRGLSCLVIEDAQWSVQEGDGLAIAEAVVQSAVDADEEKRLLVLVTLRSEALRTDPALRQRVDELVAHGARRIDLPRLDLDGTRLLLAESLTLRPRLAEMVAHRCEGNPLFARQLLLEWVDRGWLVDAGGLQFDLVSGVDANHVLPPDAEALLLKRLQGLAEASGQPVAFRDGVHMTALAGQAVPAQLVELLVGPALAGFTRGSGLFVQDEDLLRFDSTMLHEAVKGEADARADAGDLHRRLGRAWGQYGEQTGVRVDLAVGRHAVRGSDWTVAISSLLAAAESAHARGRTHELDEASQLAVEAVGRSRGLHRYAGAAHLWRARSFQVRGESAEAGRLYRESLEAFAAMEERAGVVDARLGCGWAALQAGEIAETEIHYREALTGARELGDPRMEARVIAATAVLEQQKRNVDGANILYTRVLNRLAALDDEQGVAEALLGQANLARRTGSFADAEELYQEAVEAFEKADDVLGIARARGGWGISRRQLRDGLRAEELFRDCMNTAEDLGATEILMDARLSLADLYRQRAQHDRAERAYDLCRTWAERQGNFQGAVLANIGLAHLALERDDLDAMYGFATDAVVHLNRAPGHWLWATYRLVVATMLARRLDHENTWAWLWSASELGLGDTVDLDLARDLLTICRIARKQRWTNVVRVAGNLARRQLDRLELGELVLEVERHLAEVGR